MQEKQQKIKYQQTNEKTQNKRKIIKKLPALHQKVSYNQIYIKSGRPMIVYQKHSEKVLNKYNTLIIHGLTATIQKAISLSVKLRKQYPYLVSQVYTDSIPTIVQFQGGKKQIKQRSAIHIVLKKTDSRL